MTTLSSKQVSGLWIVLLTLASTAVTLALACATPFTALAALAATQMRARDGVPVMLAAWLASRGAELCVGRYPSTLTNAGWAVMLAVAAVAAVIAARAAADRVAGSEVLRIAAAYGAAMLGFKAVILIGSFGLGGGAMAFAPHVLLREFVRNGAILVGLLALYRALVAVGLPAAPQGRWALAT